MNSLWLNLRMNGILCAYLRAHMPSTPSVDATALQPPSIASLTMFSGSKYMRVRRERRAGGMLDALVDRQDRHVAGAGEPAVIEQRLQPAEHRHRPVRVEVNALDEVRTRQVQRLFRNRLALVLQQAGGVGSEDLFDGGHNLITLSPRRTEVTLTRGYDSCSTTALSTAASIMVSTGSVFSASSIGVAPGVGLRMPRREQRARVLVGHDRDVEGAEPLRLRR